MEPRMIQVSRHVPTVLFRIAQPPKLGCQCKQGCSENLFRPLKRLIKKREQMGLTQAQMASRFRVSQQFYSKVERGEKLCPDRILSKLKIKGSLYYRGVCTD